MMKRNSKKKEKLLNMIGMGCGIFLAAELLINVGIGMIPKTVGVKAGDIPSTAKTLRGTAPGKVGDVTVEIIADENKLYQINIVEHTETDGIGTKAVDALPGAIFEAQSLNVDSVSGATVTSDAIKAAIVNALESGDFSAEPFGVEAGSSVAAKPVAHKVQTMSGVTVLHAVDWKEEFPDQYNSWTMTKESSYAEDYLEMYPMLRGLYEGYGFAKDYKAARGHYYNIEDIEATGRPHPLANCWTCKTPDFTNMVNEEGISAYKKDWTEVQSQIVEGISCYTCHANSPGDITITHTYWIDAVGDDFDSIAPADLACGQCHNEYYFDPETKATTIAHNSLDSMSPDLILAYFNDASNFSTGEPFTDWTNPRTGVKQIKVQHPEFETYLGAGSPHAGTFTCADCHMPDAVSSDGRAYHSHNIMSPLDNPELLANTCSACHADLVSEVHALQKKVEDRTYTIGYRLEYLTELLASAVASGEYTDEQLDPIRSLARDAQFYWDFVFVENAEGAHNPQLTYECLDKADSLYSQAVDLLFRLTR